MRKALAAALCLLLLASTEAAMAEKTVTLTFVGDCTLGGEDWLINREGSFHDYARKKGYFYFFDKMRDFFAQDDLTIANFEGVLKEQNLLFPRPDGLCAHPDAFRHRGRQPRQQPHPRLRQARQNQHSGSPHRRGRACFR